MREERRKSLKRGKGESLRGREGGGKEKLKVKEIRGKQEKFKKRGK